MGLHVRPTEELVSKVVEHERGFDLCVENRPAEYSCHGCRVVRFGAPSKAFAMTQKTSYSEQQT